MAEEITLETIGERLNEQGLAKTTIKSYHDKLSAMYDVFKGKGKDLKSMRDVFDDDKKIIEWIHNGGNGSIKSPSTTTRYKDFRGLPGCYPSFDYGSDSNPTPVRPG
jgi:hypothetical protein